MSHNPTLLGLLRQWVLGDAYFSPSLTSVDPSIPNLPLENPDLEEESGGDGHGARLSLALAAAGLLLAATSVPVEQETLPIAGAASPAVGAAAQARGVAMAPALRSRVFAEQEALPVTAPLALEEESQFARAVDVSWFIPGISEPELLARLDVGDDDAAPPARPLAPPAELAWSTPVEPEELPVAAAPAASGGGAPIVRVILPREVARLRLIVEPETLPVTAPLALEEESQRGVLPAEPDAVRPPAEQERLPVAASAFALEEESRRGGMPPDEEFVVVLLSDAEGVLAIGPELEPRRPVPPDPAALDLGTWRPPVEPEVLPTGDVTPAPDAGTSLVRRVVLGRDVARLRLVVEQEALPVAAPLALEEASRSGRRTVDETARVRTLVEQELLPVAPAFTLEEESRRGARGIGDGRTVAPPSEQEPWIAASAVVRPRAHDHSGPLILAVDWSGPLVSARDLSVPLVTATLSHVEDPYP